MAGLFQAIVKISTSSVIVIITLLSATISYNSSGPQLTKARVNHVLIFIRQSRRIYGFQRLYVLLVDSSAQIKFGHLHRFPRILFSVCRFNTLLQVFGKLEVFPTEAKCAASLITVSIALLEYLLLGLLLCNLIIAYACKHNVAQFLLA